MNEKITENDVRQLLKNRAFTRRVDEHIDETLAAYLEKKEVLKTFDRTVAQKEIAIGGLEKQERDLKEKIEEATREHKDALVRMRAEKEAKEEEIKAITHELTQAQAHRDQVVKEREDALAGVQAQIAEAQGRYEKIKRQIDQRFAEIDNLRRG